MSRREPGRVVRAARLQRRRPLASVYQTVPTPSFDAVDQRRHHAIRPDGRFHPRPVAGFCTLCSPRGHCRCCLCSHPFLPPPPSCPAFPRRGFATRAFHGSLPLQYYAGSDSCRASPARQASPVHLSRLPSIQPPPTLRARTSRAYHLVRPVGPCRVQASPLLGGSPPRPAESGSFSCRLLVRLRLLPTPPPAFPQSDDAVAFGYMCGDFTWHGLPPADSTD